jgi:hypothetical protein
MRRLLSLLLLTGLCQAQQQGGGLGSPRQNQEPLQTHDQTATQRNARLRVAVERFNKHLPLPGLPKLDRPVIVKSGSWVCNEDIDLITPSRFTMVGTGQCIVTKTRKLVRVVQPIDLHSYITGYVDKIVMILWTTGDQSDGNIYTAWVYIDSLVN